MATTTADVTTLLRRFETGDRGAEADLFLTLYAELHRIARYYMRGERRGHTLQPTALVNEAYLRLVRSRAGPWADKSHFIAAAAQVMRRVLVDCARRSRAKKRHVTPPPEVGENLMATAWNDPALVLAVDTALTALAARDARKARVVELRFFAGMSLDETAAATGLSIGTVKREWTFARAWLRGELRRLGAIAGE